MMRWSPAVPTRASCPHRRLRRLLARELPVGLTLGLSTLRPWASANFVGARHIFACDATSPASAGQRPALQDSLAQREWHLPGHLVADVVVEWADDPAILRIEILTVED